ncbi:membrane protein YdbS with pleckstrin-like domain [Methanocalculus alkaliphilus]|uniref:hypothetical protein n=1 Tax=Methanocalculus alkaliphilus TaxID=768730 RepID=UPI0020A10A11|nr:hypothetical protein [Methanocalculus alkaliphilus]MCP1714358.1 membrane protein YdbS with pleckstrin-like domain [Methanocalculus alkaliphilus]
MDESARQIFKFKYIKLVMMLNVLIFSVAAAILIFFIVPPEYALRMPVVAALAVIAVVTGVVTRKSYIETKKWLDIHGKSA